MRKLVYIIVVFFLVPIACQNLAQQPGGAVEPNPEAPEILAEARDVALESDFSPAVVDEIGHYFSKRNRNNAFNGTVLFAQNGQIRYSEAFGFADLRTKDSLTIESAFQLASVSKPITAIATLMLVDQGKIGLEDTLQTYFPEFPYEGITIRMLLNHRSGLPNYMYFCDSMWENKEKAITNRDVLKLMIQYQPKSYYPPDHRYNYSNTNYALLALLIEDVSQMAYELFVKTRIFLPLGMNSSQIYNKSVTPENFMPVHGYVSSRREAENTYLNGVVGDKGVYASVVDLFKLDQGLRNGQLLSQSMLDAAFEPQHKDLYAWDNYGLGWRIDDSDPDNKVVYHTGWWKGFRSYFIRELGTDKTLIVLTNTSRNTYIGSRELRELMLH